MTNYLANAGVQQFSITIASGQTTGTATINAVGSAAFILFGGINPSVNNNPAEDFAYLTLTNSTTITATRNIGTAGTVVVTGSIVDGHTTNLIKSVQYGTVTIAASSSSGTAAISAVTNNNTATHLLGWSSANSTLNTTNEYPVLSLSGTTVTAATKGATGSGLVVGFAIIEFQGTALNQNVQNISATSSGNVLSYTAPVTSVNVNNAFCIYAGSQIASINAIASTKQYGTLTNSTTFTVNVVVSAGLAKKYNCSIVEFVSGVLNSNVQRDTTSIGASGTSATSTISSVSFTNATLSWLGNDAGVSGAGTVNSEGAGVLTDSHTVTVQRNAAVSGTTTLKGSWEVVEFTALLPGQSVGSSSGTSTVVATGISTFSAVGSTSGAATVTATGKSTAKAVGAASGTATVKGVRGFIGAASGTAVALATGTTGKAATATASGTATVTAHGVTGTAGHGTAAGTATVTAAGRKGIAGAGAAAGTVTVVATGRPLYKAKGSASGSSSATAAAKSLFKAVVAAHGIATAQGEAPPVRPQVDVLSFMTKVPVNSTATMSDDPVSVEATMNNLLPMVRFMSPGPVNSTATISNTPVSILGNF